MINFIKCKILINKYSGIRVLETKVIQSKKWKSYNELMIVSSF